MALRLPRRLQFVLALTLFVLAALFFLGTSNTHDFDPYLEQVPAIGSHLQEGVQHAVEVAQGVVDHVPTLLGPAAHTPPPEQANSTSGQAKWYSSWNWDNPFSDTVTADEERAVLPPLRPRPPVYTYFDPGNWRKDDKSKEAEHELLNVWRRAWWAQGFKPVILTSAEATRHPLHRQLQGRELQPEMMTELLRWLAWSSMGAGILTDWLAVPMAPYDDPLLTFLRRGQYPALVQYDDLQAALLVGPKDRVETAITEALASRALPDVHTMYEAVSHEHLQQEPGTKSIAHYGEATLRKQYVPLRKLLEDPATVADAWATLPDLINAHLHTTWLASYPKGIAVLKPLAAHASILVEPAMAIARNLTHCPPNPIPLSCPPNRARCVECLSDHFPIKTPTAYKNDSRVFTIGTIPHPYTTTSLVKGTDELDARFVRRETGRDLWVRALTSSMLHPDRSSFARLAALKEAIASHAAGARAIWLTAERPFQRDSSHVLDDLDWTLGFRIRRAPAAAKASTARPPGRAPVAKPKHPFGDGKAPPPDQIALQRRLLGAARDAFTKASKTSKDAATEATANFRRLQTVLEGWNLADAEIWKFVRAFNARDRLERTAWDEEERDFMGKNFYDRWMDKIL